MLALVGKDNSLGRFSKSPDSKLNSHPLSWLLGVKTLEREVWAGQHCYCLFSTCPVDTQSSPHLAA